VTRQATRLLAALAAAPERRQAAMIALLLVVGIGILYLPRLDWSPVYLAHDEVIYALNAHSIATTARDINGQFLPVSIYVVGTFFATPLQIYFTALALLIAMAVQFAGFYRDYFGDYRVRSYPWFEHNIRGGMEDLISRQGSAPAPIYIAQNIQWSDYYWPLYLVKHGRMDLRPHTNFLDLQAADAIAAIAGGSLALCRASDEAVLIGAGFHRLRAIQEPDGTHSFSVLQK